MIRLDDILGITPFIELFIRGVYYSENKFIKKMIALVNLKHKHRRRQSSDNNIKNKVFDYIKRLGIRQGNILIVHTSQENLENAGINSIELIKFLREIIGEKGTLVFPAYPLYNEKNFDSENGLYIYNPKKAICLTGMIPNLFLRMPNVKRSIFPWNTLAAQGPDADKMMEHNLETDLSYGPGSAWEYCYKKRAKILLLGVKSNHTTSMVHTAEDLMDDEWPIEGWYEKKKIYIDSDEMKGEITIRLRRMKWAKYNASWYRTLQLKKKGYLTETNICGLNIGFIKDSKEMVDYIIDRNYLRRGFFVVPKKYYKRMER